VIILPSFPMKNRRQRGFSATFNFDPNHRRTTKKSLLRSGIPWWTGHHTDTNANSVTVCDGNSNANKHTYTNSYSYCTATLLYTNGYTRHQDLLLLESVHAKGRPTPRPDPDLLWTANGRMGVR